MDEIFMFVSGRMLATSYNIHNWMDKVNNEDRRICTFHNANVAPGTSF
jgi:hypothetical protein